MNDDSGDDVEFLGSFSGLHDPRQQAKVMYPLQEILTRLTGCDMDYHTWYEP